MEEVIERVVMRLNEVCETVADRFSTQGELGDFCSQLLRHEKFVQWEVLRETFVNFKEFETTLNKKRGTGCVNVEVMQKQDHKSTGCGAAAVLKLLNIPRHGDKLVISLDVKQEGVDDDILLRTVYNLRKDIDEKKSDASFLLWVTSSHHTSGETIDTNVRHLADKNSVDRPKQQFVWDVVRDTTFDLQFQLCPPGSRLSLTLWRISE